MIFAPYKAYCEERKQQHLFRELTETRLMHDGCAERGVDKLINFGGNDYLGLSQHPALITRAQDYAMRYGAGTGASRLVTGNSPPYAAIEQILARGKRSEAALVLNSGYQANLTVLAALADRDVVGKPVTILADKLCHNSLLQGAFLSGAKLIRYLHNDMGALEELLKRESLRDVHIVIVTESVFSMDGDVADLPALLDLKQRYNAMLYLDEAHATGIFGPDGFGFSSTHDAKVDLVMGTFGKALGSFGAYITCSAVLRDYLIQRCGGLIYSTALPPATLGSIEAAIELLPKLADARATLLRYAEKLRDGLRAQGWDCGQSTTQIVPVILGGEEAANGLAAILREHGILAPSIRPPTVPRETSRLRLSPSAVHKTDDIDRLLEIMAQQVETFAAPRKALAS